VNKSVNFELTSDDPLTLDIVESGVVSFHDLIRCVRRFHYGRNSQRADLNLVWYERRGTCSSKHAFLKNVAELNQIPNVELMMCLFKMNSDNTKGLVGFMEQTDLEYIPEAHCYIRWNNEPIDVTFMGSNIDQLLKATLEEKQIQAKDVVENKLIWHKQKLVEWLDSNRPNMTLEEIWGIRERAIQYLED